MSTIKVTNIDPPSAGGAVNVNGVSMPSAGPLSNRNFIINGGMTVAQRDTQVTGSTGDGYKTVDRFRVTHSSLGTFTYDQDTDAPPGFSNSFKASCTTADTSPAASDLLTFMQRIEAQDLQVLGYGTADAKSSTLSFWVKSNKTGNASVDILQNDNSNKLVSFQYSISAADTWEYKTISIPGDTAGVINNDNGYGLQIAWTLNSGSNFTSGSHRATWTTYNNGDRNVSNLGIGGSTSDYWQITGVQLELGDQATPFEHRSYVDELRRCQRYLFRIQGNSSDQSAVGIGFNHTSDDCRVVFQLPVAMRERNQTCTESGLQSLYTSTATVGLTVSGLDENVHAVGLTCTADTGAPFTAGRANFIRLTADAASFLQIESEL